MLLKLICFLFNCLCLFLFVLSLQISEGLSFLHSGVKMVHGNLCPDNIILNKSGAWKIMGFDFSISSINPSDAEVVTVLIRSVIERLYFSPRSYSHPCFLLNSAEVHM